MADNSGGAIAATRAEPQSFDPFADATGDDASIFGTPVGTDQNSEGGSGGFIEVDPASVARSGIGTGSADTGSPRRRGPRPGSKRQAKTQASANLGNLLATGIGMMHMFMLARTKAPEWSISDAEALKLGNAVSDVLAEYGLTASRKIGAWGTLAMISGEVYGGRVLHYVGRSVGNSKPKAAPSQPAHNPFAGFAVAA